MARTMLLLLLLTLVISQHAVGGTMFRGDEEGLELEEIGGPETSYPEGDPREKSESYELIPSADTLSWPGRSNICYFIREGRLESQLSCHLRFTRSKFNFNPFGLRFGKRARGDANGEGLAPLVPRRLLPFLLKLKDKRCSESVGETC
ncbi:kisspeptin isoform X1 [Xenopus tropicalis]|uniref:Kisspeptin 2 n=2 Tax=Xenopus tropicalis TaxID=8364 RepID=A0A803K5V2_XENTR|nr:kisspeptin isoform X1 [Xenopus tropicalis]